MLAILRYKLRVIHIVRVYLIFLVNIVWIFEDSILYLWHKL